MELSSSLKLPADRPQFQSSESLDLNFDTKHTRSPSLISLHNSHSSSAPSSSPTASPATTDLSANEDEDDRSDSETYLTDFGGEVVRDEEEWPSVSRADIQREYESSSEGADSDDESAASVSTLEPYADWAVAADDALELEELQERASEIDGQIADTEIDADVDTDDDIVDDDETDVLEDDLSDLELSDTEVPVLKRGRPQMIEQEFEPADLSPGTKEDVEVFGKLKQKDGGRREIDGVVELDSSGRGVGLQKRLERVVDEMAQLQIVTAGRAADAQEWKAEGLSGEAQRLHGALDRLARLLLERAFQVRDDLESHL